MELVAFTRKEIKMEEYHLQGSQLHDWAIISIDEEGRFYAKTKNGDFSYHWILDAEIDFKEFLASLMHITDNIVESRLYRYLTKDKYNVIIDVTETISRIKKYIIKQRKAHRNKITKEDARRLYDAFEALEIKHPVKMDHFTFFDELTSMGSLKHHIISWEKLIDDDSELVRYVPDEKAYEFCKEIAPAFYQVLKKETEVRDEV